MEVEDLSEWLLGWRRCLGEASLESGRLGSLELSGVCVLDRSSSLGALSRLPRGVWSPRLSGWLYDRGRRCLCELGVSDGR